MKLLQMHELSGKTDEDFIHSIFEIHLCGEVARIVICFVFLLAAIVHSTQTAWLSRVMCVIWNEPHAHLEARHTSDKHTIVSP